MGKLLTALLVLAACFAGPARADTGNGPYSGPKGDHDQNALWVDINSVADGSAEDTGTLAQIICSKLEAGASEGDLIAAGAKGNQSAVPKTALIVHAVEWHYCPDYY